MSEQKAGVLYGVAAYTFWGIAPVYFVWISFAEPLEVIAHRSVWSLLVLVLLVAASGQLHKIAQLSRRQLFGLFLSSLLLSINWLTFVWAVFDDRILETSLGYYINPLVTVLLGVLFLGERLSLGQSAAIGLAAIAVLLELFTLGTVPVLALLLAVTFGCYGLVRKQVEVPSIVGLTVETALLFPFAMTYLVWMTSQGAGTLAEGFSADLGKLMLGAGVTILPLLWFASAATRVPLVVVGFLQYIAPSLSFVLAIAVFHEPLRAGQIATFGLIWIALVIFAWDGYVQHRRQVKPATTGTP